MGPKFSEGAIVQHLSKLRVRRLKEGKLVPPPLRRAAGTSKAGSKGTAPNVGGTIDELPVEDDVVDETSDESDPEYGKPTSKKSKRQGKGRVKKTKFKRKFIARDFSPEESEKACTNAPFLDFNFDEQSEQEEDLPGDECETSSESANVNNEDTLLTSPKPSPGFKTVSRNKRQYKQRQEESDSAEGRNKKIRLKLKEEGHSDMASSATSTPVALGNESMSTPGPTFGIDHKNWNLQTPGDTSSVTPDFFSSPVPYQFPINPLSYPVVHGHPQAPEWNYSLPQGFPHAPGFPGGQMGSYQNLTVPQHNHQVFPRSHPHTQPQLFSQGPEHHQLLAAQHTAPVMPFYEPPPSPSRARLHGVNPQDLLKSEASPLSMNHILESDDEAWRGNI